MSNEYASFILVGGCGSAGCLDCLPLFIVECDPDTGNEIQREVADFSYTLVEK